MTLTFFDGPLEGISFAIGSNHPISKLLIENDRGDLLRYECDQIQESFDTRDSDSITCCRMVLSRLPVEFDDELRISLAEEK